ncbi:MAG: TonB-dependent receptor [Cytophagales bacterium]|nr:TonB-dependent receptor [Cytophagales bacterium]
MKKERTVWAISLIAMTCLASNQIQAQQDSLSSVKLLDLVITATKFPKDVNETAKVLTIIDEVQIARSSGKDVSQLLNEQTGLIINGANSNPGKDKSVFLRGAKSDYTVVLLDGIPLNDPSSLGGGAYDLRLIPIDQVERIEILKGSQSTLYGSDAIAGVINIITKKKGSKPIEGFASAGYGSYNTIRGNGGITGSSKNFEYAVNYSRYQTNGISEAIDSTRSSSFDNDGYDQNAIQVNTGLILNKSLSLRPYVRYTNFRGGYDAGSFTDSRKNFYSSNLLNAGFSAQYVLRNGAVNLLYGYDRTDRTFDTDFGLNVYKGRFSHAEIFWNNNLGEHLQILVGVSRQDISIIDTTAIEKNPSMTLTSPYGSVFIKNFHGFSAELGGRYNRHSKFGNVFTYSFNPSYLINKKVKVFANVATGFKSPNLGQLFGPFGANPDLKPERSQSFEGGIQFFNLSGKLDARVTAFKRKISDLIFYSFDPNTFQSKYINLNEQDDNGIEIELNVKVRKGLNLRAWYAYIDGRVTDKGGLKDTSYNNLFRRPRHSVGVFVGYQATRKLFVSANLRAFSGRSDLYFNLSNFTTENVSLDTFSLLDVYMEYNLIDDNFKIFADVKNLMNKDYMETYGYNTLKINMMVGFNYRF